MTAKYTMGAHARTEWREWLKARLARAGSTQQKLAFSIFGARENDDSPKNTTEVNRFCSGEAAILERWFERHPERIKDVATELDLPVDELRSKLDILISGIARPISWHPAFPAVSEEAAVIPAPLDGPRGESTPASAARDFADRLGAPEGWKHDTMFGERLELVAPPGASRRIAVQQLRDALEHELRLRVAAARTKDPKRDVPEAVVRVADTPSKPGKLEVQVVGTDPPPPGTWSVPALRLARWGPAQAVALARTLAACADVPLPGRTALERFATDLVEHPGWTDAVLDPDLVIRWLAEVARAGAPSSGAAARGLLTAGAWGRCQAAAAGALDALDEGFLDRLFARIATRTRGPAEAGCWTRTPRSYVLECIAEALDCPIEGRSRREILGLVDALSAPGRGKEDRISALRAAVATASPREVAAGLEQGGVLRGARGGTVEAVDPRLAAAHAARGLRSAKVFADHPELLVDPHGAWLADELARHGVPWPEIVDATDQQPPELAADVALARLRFAWCSDAPILPEVLIASWAAVLWSVAHALYCREPHGLYDEWTRDAQPLLRQVSWRFRTVLPLLGADPVEDLRPFVPPPVLALVARWRRTPPFGEPDHEPSQKAQLGLVVGEFRRRQDLEAAVRWLAPAQLHPVRAWEYWQGREREVSHVDRLQEVAGAGDAAALDSLTGRAWLREERTAEGLGAPARSTRRGDRPAAELWQSLPGEVRLSWALHHGPRGDDGWEVYHSIVGALRYPRGQYADAPIPIGRDHPCFAELVRFGAELDREQIEDLCIRTLVPGGGLWPPRFPPELAWALAEGLALTELLEELVTWPGRVLPSSALAVDLQGLLLTWGDEGASVRLPVRWPSRGGEAGRGRTLDVPSLGLDELASNWRDWGLRAAVVLARLGRDAPLLTLWRAEEVADLPVSVSIDGRLFELLLMVLRTPELFLRDAPAAELHALDPGEGVRPEPEWSTRLVLTRQFGVPPELADPWIAAEHRAAYRGLATLVDRPPATWPEAIREWLVRSPFGSLPFAAGHGSARASSQAHAVARELLELGHDAPIDRWAEGHHVALDRTPPARADSANAQAVKEWSEARPDRLDRVWSALLRHGPRQDAQVFDRLRDSLLSAGSFQAGWRDDATPRAGCPRPFVVKAALEDAVTSDRLHDANARSPSWAPVLRMRVHDAPDARTAARWAVRLAESEPGCPEIEQSLRHWLVDDPTPWAGPVDWDGPDNAGRFVGGTFSLLHLALARHDAWVTDGLVRLWEDGRTRPWLKHRGDEEPEAAQGWWHNDGSFGPPTVVRTLAGALIERGRAEVVVSAWPPPTPRQPDGRPVEERSSQLRSWLGTIAVGHAPDALLRARVEAWMDQPEELGFPLTEARELFRRGAPGLESVAIRIARDFMFPELAMVARIAPQEIGPIAEARIRAGADLRSLVWNLIAASHGAADEAPQAAMVARRLLRAPEGS